MNEHGCFIHVETSSHTDIESIQFLFDKIAKKIVQEKAYFKNRQSLNL